MSRLERRGWLAVALFTAIVAGAKLLAMSTHSVLYGWLTR